MCPVCGLPLGDAYIVTRKDRPNSGKHYLCYFRTRESSLPKRVQFTLDIPVRIGD